MTTSIIDDPEVRRWLGGVEPIWTLLAPESMGALLRPPSSSNRALMLARDLTESEINASAVARNALILIARAAEGFGLELKANGNLTTEFVAEMIDVFEWPGVKRADAHLSNSAIDEPDFLPLFFVRRVAELAKLIQRQGRRLITTPLGRDTLRREKRRALLAQLFHIAFWRDDLSYLGRGIHGSWPQGGVGAPFWSLHVAATRWLNAEELTRLCVIPVREVIEANWDTGSLMMEARILRPLVWFGLLDTRAESTSGIAGNVRHFYRKTTLFDRFLSFDVRIDPPSTVFH